MALARPQSQTLPLLTGFVLVMAASLLMVPIAQAIDDLFPAIAQADQENIPTESVEVQGWILAGPASTPVLVKSDHGLRKHGDVRHCFENGRGTLHYMQEITSGRIHVICALSETEFYDLIVQDCTDANVCIEQVTALRIDRYKTLTEFFERMQVRPLHPARFILPPDWAADVFTFIFGF